MFTTTQQAAAQAKAEGLNIEFIQSDMRTFSRPDAFDWVTNLLTSFGYFEDPQEDEEVAANMYRSLKSNGVLIMDLVSKEVLARNFEPRRWHEEGNAIFLQETTVHKAWTWIESRWIILRDNERFERTLSHRIYSAAELMSLLTKVGFRDLEVYGDLEGNPYDHTAKRLVVIARK